MWHIPRALFFVVPGFLFGLASLIPSDPITPLLLFWTGVNLVCAGLGTHWKLPGLTGKNLDGSIPYSSNVFWAPYFLMLRIYVHIYFRRIKYRNFPIITQIHEDWYLGGWPHAPHVLPPELLENEFLMIDMTCELPREIKTVRKEHYINIPCWDGTGPTIQEFTAQVDRVVKLQQQTSLPVLVHCGFGRGRSLTFLLACLVARGLHPDWEKAYQYVISKRRIVHVPRALKPLLLEWTAARDNVKKLN